MVKAFNKILLFIFIISFQPFLLKGQSVKEIDREELFELLSIRNDTTYVINFWATWCSPCIKEIPYFNELDRIYQGKSIQIILVSLDFPNQVEQRVKPFLLKNNIGAEVRLMTDLDYDGWIDAVDPSWSGAIPATIIFNRNSRNFFEKELSREELFNIVEQNIL